MTELTMPKLSDSMADAVIVRWLVSPGAAFARGEALIEVETDKATVVYEAEDAGTLESILVPEGEAAAVGQAIATLANGDGAAPAPPAVKAAAAPPAPEAAARPASAAAAPASGRPNATPVARRVAVELGVSLHEVAGTGPGGRITQQDVQRAADGATVRAPAPPTAAPAGKGEVRVVELTTTQATIARRMVESATTIPVFTVSSDVDMSLIVALRQGARAERDDAPSVNDFVVKAAALTLRELPRFNGSYVDGRIETYSRVNVGVAVATEDALLVPVVRDADSKTVTEISAETRRVADAARRRTLAPADLADATFTVSNLGMFGVRSFTAIVDVPQTAILAVGAVRREPVETAGGGVSFRDVATFTLSCDHRIVYGADGARFLSRLRELLERPLLLVS